MAVEVFKRLQDQAYDYLLERILAGAFEEDHLYSETSMAEELCISRTPLHNALSQLQQEGYIDIFPSRGFSLRKMTQKDLQEIYQVCVALEEFCAFQILRERDSVRGVDVIRRLELCIAEQEHICKEGKNVAAFIECDYRLHMLIIAYAKNSVFEQTFSNYRNRIQKQLAKSLAAGTRMQRSLEEHRQICAAIKSADLTQIMSCMTEHHNDFCR